MITITITLLVQFLIILYLTKTKNIFKELKVIYFNGFKNWVVGFIYTVILLVGMMTLNKIEFFRWKLFGQTEGSTTNTPIDLWLVILLTSIIIFFMVYIPQLTKRANESMRRYKSEWGMMRNNILYGIILLLLNLPIGSIISFLIIYTLISLDYVYSVYNNKQTEEEAFNDMASIEVIFNFYLYILFILGVWLTYFNQ